MQNYSEKERKYVADLINNDEAAFCELYAMYKERLIYFAMKFLKSTEFAEDIFQDTFTAIWQNRHSLNPDVPFAPYVYTIMKNRLLNLLSGLEKDENLKKHIFSLAIDVNETENHLMGTDLNGLLKNALENLTAQQRRVFEMSRKELKSHKEIALELGISVYTVQQHISTSLKLIRNYLIKYSDIYADIVIMLLCLNC